MDNNWASMHDFEDADQVAIHIGACCVSTVDHAYVSESQFD